MKYLIPIVVLIIAIIICIVLWQNSKSKSEMIIVDGEVTPMIIDVPVGYFYQGPLVDQGFPRF
jgi:hypothetical protein